MRPKSLPLFLSCAAVLACVTTAAHAWADGPTKLWLEARPFTCDGQLPALARELTLACDAAGGACVIASSEAMADRRIVLHCSEEAWTVEATSPAGQRAWSVEVYGSDADRTRSAAVFTVRAETGEAAPHQVALAAAPATPKVPARLAVPAEDRERAEPTGRPSILSVAAAPRVSYAVGRADYSFMSGVAGYGALTLNRFFHAGLTAAVEGGHTDDGGPASNMHWHFSGGALLGVGAPFDHVPFGLFVETTYGTVLFTEDVSPLTGVSPSGTMGFLSGRFGLVYQLYETSSVRPWLALSGRQTWSTFGPIGQLSVADTYASLDLGVAWDP